MKEQGLTRFLLLAIWAGIAILLLMPFLIGIDTIFPYIVRKSIFARSVIEVIAGLWLILILQDARYRPKPSWVVYALSAYLLVSVVSAAFGVSFNRSMWSTYERMMGVWDLMHWVLFILIAASVLRTARAWFWLLNWNLFLTLLLCLISFLESYNIGKGALPRSVGDFLYPDLVYVACKPRFCATVGNPSFLAAILVVNIPLAVGLFVRSFVGTKDRSPVENHGASWQLWGARGFWALTSVTSIWILYQNGTRGAFIGLAAAALFLGVLALFRVHKGAKKPLFAIATLIFGGLLILYLWDISSGVPTSAAAADRNSTAGERLSVNLVSDSSVRGRLIAARAGMEGFLERPLLGWGADNFIAAFDHNVRAEDFRYGENLVDNAHNKIIDELVTKGILGGVSYLALWACLLWLIVRRHRRPRDEILAYVVLCSLAAYFVQNLLLFDTPAMILQWSLLAAFVAAQGNNFPDEEAEPSGSTAEPEQSPQPVTGQPSLPDPSRQSKDAAPSEANAHSLIHGWAFAGVALVIIGLVSASLYMVQYRSYQAARSFEKGLEDIGMYREVFLASERAPVEALPTLRAEMANLFEKQLAHFQRAIDLAPTLGNEPRRAFFATVVGQLQSYTPEQQQRALDLFSREWLRGLDADPSSFQYLRSVIFFFQSLPQTETTAKSVEHLLERLEKIGPERFEVAQHRAIQAYSQGNYARSIEIIEGSLAVAPGVEAHFISIETVICKQIEVSNPEMLPQVEPCYRFAATSRLLELLQKVGPERVDLYKKLVTYALANDEYARGLVILDAFTSKGGILDAELERLQRIGRQNIKLPTS